MKYWKLSLIVTIIIVIVLLAFGEFGSTVKVEPVLFTNHKVYSLLNQHAGNYLTVGKGGTPYRSSDHGARTDDQLWKVKAISKEGFKLVPINGEPELAPIWKPVYLGYGKYQLKNLEADTCLDAQTMKETETTCSRDNLYQEWFPTLSKDH